MPPDCLAPVTGDSPHALGGRRGRPDDEDEVVAADDADAVADARARITTRLPDLPVEPHLARGVTVRSHDRLFPDQRLGADDLSPVLHLSVPAEQLEHPERDDDEERDEVPRPRQQQQKQNRKEDEHARTLPGTRGAGIVLTGLKSATKRWLWPFGPAPRACLRRTPR